MINEAPKPDLKRKVAKTNKRGQTLKNFRLSQKDSKDAQDRAKKAQAQAPAGSALKTKADAPYSAQNYKATMAKRKADQRKQLLQPLKRLKQFQLVRHIRQKAHNLNNNLKIIIKKMMIKKMAFLRKLAKC